MPSFQLRLYNLKTAALASQYAQRYKPTMTSLAKLNIVTRAVYLNETNPKQVIAIIELPDGDNAALEAKIEEYVHGEDFAKDMGDVELSSFEGIETSFLRPLEFSPGR